MAGSADDGRRVLDFKTFMKRALPRDRSGADIVDKIGIATVRSNATPFNNGEASSTFDINGGVVADIAWQSRSKSIGRDWWPRVPVE